MKTKKLASTKGSKVKLFSCTKKEFKYGLQYIADQHDLSVDELIDFFSTPEGKIAHKNAVLGLRYLLKRIGLKLED
jgi:hypothetical protein